MRRTMVTAAAASMILMATSAGVPADARHGPQPGAARGVAPVFEEVAKNLNNPRQIAFGRDGSMYVAEAGYGNFKGTERTRCFPGAEGGTVCVGATGSVTRVRHGKQHRVVKHLASIAAQVDGSSALGPSDLVVVGKHTIVLSMGLGTDPADRKNLPKVGRTELARLLGIDLKSHTTRVVGDLGAHEAASNPIDNPDTDPTGLARAGRLGFLATDSGGNTLVQVKHKHVHGVAAFKDRKQGGTKYQSVPTDVVKGPDGAWYVSELTGAPFFPGAARIWRIVPGHKAHVWASGLTNVTSLAFQGRKVYAVQIADAGLADPGGPIGSLRRVFSDKSGKGSVPIASGLFAPYGVALHHGAAYVSTCAVCYQGGTVIKVPLK